MRRPLLIMAHVVRTDSISNERVSLVHKRVLKLVNFFGQKTLKTHPGWIQWPKSLKIHKCRKYLSLVPLVDQFIGIRKRFWLHVHWSLRNSSEVFRRAWCSQWIPGGSLWCNQNLTESTQETLLAAQGAPSWYSKQQVSMIITLDIQSMSQVENKISKMIELCQQQQRRTVNTRWRAVLTGSEGFLFDF